MENEFQSSKPIYLQIADRIYYRLIRSELSPGDKLPSVREMAVQMKVNPNTIQRTYSEMERLGIVETRRGQGTFIAERSDLKAELKDRLTKDVFKRFIQEMVELGLSPEEMLEGIKQYAEEANDES
ncbi:MULTISPECIES: GntR family transcriptional regulator [Bacillus amyloliquefaciens group]|uniref:GntR family transcriptional regulator n=1 Tax=Bacillus amyloliquefaciens group TaxID=1938374 RepID=UPI001A993831|nr:MULTISPECIES: GntR family transcriptional regulator [Bacillus amyloliquefaciens group]UXZ18793.1 GntR family transcriptional regulator [Bacillus siamensis]MBR8695069.1 GntR family transcriptional regulator [Bacillus velezensis]MBY6038645.1 GntR family transcriptional regulator [Bacillus velezensis]MCA1240069.1 GntR family transcriptional regulator [Bacillus velezensis]MCX2884841.1 GntR family transcriptional regulator [Bacillus velezensis]